MNIGRELVQGVLLIFIAVLFYFIATVIIDSFFIKYFDYNKSDQAILTYGLAKEGLLNSITWVIVLIAGVIIFALFRLLVISS